MLQALVNHCLTSYLERNLKVEKLTQTEPHWELGASQLDPFSRCIRRAHSTKGPTFYNLNSLHFRSNTASFGIFRSELQMALETATKAIWNVGELLLQ